MRNEYETQGEHGDVPTLGKQGKAVPRGAPTSGEVRMAKVIVVTSGKGGVGKTTTTASLAAGFAQHGLKTVAIDFDVGLRNLDLIMGVERRVVYDLVCVVKQEASLRQALIRDKRLENLSLLPASQTRDRSWPPTWQR